MSAPSLLIWVQHLFGKGHVQRMARLAAACADSGMAVTVLAGGPDGRKGFRNLKGVSAHQLPALRTKDHQYTGLLTNQGDAPGVEHWQMRREAAFEVLKVTQPDIICCELFPFGRRKFAGEVLALLEAARELPSKPLIVSSVRDIVEPKQDPKKSAQMASWLSEYFDAVLVHGDENIIRLEETAPFVANAGVPLYYTGYIAPSPTPPSPTHAGPKAGVVVSAGSGLSGDGLLKRAAEAGNQVANAASPWHIFVPPGVDAPSSGKNPHVFVHPFGNTFAGHMARARISISEAGYNTTAEALAAGTRPILVPYGEAGQTEQPTRASRFAAKGLALCLEHANLNPLSLVRSVQAAEALGEPSTEAPERGPAINLSGTQNVPGILKDLREGRLAS